MEINYNVQILNSDNQKAFEESLISEYFENYSCKISYTEFLKTRQDQYLDLLKQHADKYFPELLNALEKYYVPTQFGFFVNKSTDIPHLFVNSERHAQMILAIRLDIEQRLNQIVLMQATNVFEVVEKGYDLILKLTMHYWNIVCEYQANYTYSQNLRDKEIDKLKSKINTPIPPEPAKLTQYDEVTYRLADEVFSGDFSKLELLKYFSENFFVTAKKFTDLTKYNQIYFFLNSGAKIPQTPYKKLIKEMFGFDYENREIKGITDSHQINLENKYKDFKKSLK